jgi:hypothetical protein
MRLRSKSRVEHPPAKKGRNLVGIDLVVLGFPAVDGFHVQCVAQDEGDALAGAQIGDPVPGEDAFHRHNEIAAVGGDGFQEDIRDCG